MTQKGFTLIELMIVTAIVGILASVGIQKIMEAKHRHSASTIQKSKYSIQDRCTCGR